LQVGFTSPLGTWGVLWYPITPAACLGYVIEHEKMAIFERVPPERDFDVDLFEADLGCGDEDCGDENKGEGYAGWGNEGRGIERTIRSILREEAGEYEDRRRLRHLVKMVLENQIMALRVEELLDKELSRRGLMDGVERDLENGGGKTRLRYKVRLVFLFSSPFETLVTGWD
jgi:hypothetical protein